MPRSLKTSANLKEKVGAAGGRQESEMVWLRLQDDYELGLCELAPPGKPHRTEISGRELGDGRLGGRPGGPGLPPAILRNG